MTTKILVFSSNPLDTKQLGLRREFRYIEEARKDSKNKHKFTVLRVVAATVNDLQREIMEEKPRIVHFCGHGLGEKGLVWETQLGQRQPIGTQALAGLFELLANRVECVIFNACYSQTQAAAIEQHINYVIGTKQAIRDDAAIAFSRGFYTALFSGKPIEDAYEFGKSQIQLQFYNHKDRERKLVPVDLEQGELPEEEVFAFYIKNPLNQIEVEPEPQPQRDINIKRGNYNERIGRDYIRNQINYIQNPEPTKNLNKPSNLKKTGSVNFVGRKEKLAELHQLLQQNERVTISAIEGMGGIGKTELALQYALAYQDDYPGSLCWFSVRGGNLSTQIIEFAGTYLNLFVPEELKSAEAKVGYCWRNWRDERSLIVLDDVANYGQFYRENIAPYLPPATNNIKVLMTSRERPGSNIARIDLNVLSEEAALKLLQALIGKARIEAEPKLAKKLCDWLGYLPLGLELVGRYLAPDENLTIAKTLKRLEKKKLRARALLNPQQADMMAQLGVATAFDLSWDVLSPEAQELGCYLSLFTAEPFDWQWVESAWIETTDEDEREEEIEDLEHLRNRQLSQRNLLKAIPDNQAYQLHPLIAQYLRAKLEAREQATQLKQKFCQPLIEIAKSIPGRPTQQEIQAVTIAIPHLSLVATELTPYINDENLISPYGGLGRFYEGQGIYERAEKWREQSLTVCRERLGEQHPHVALSLSNLALLYRDQGRYADAEPLFRQALELTKQLLGENHPDVDTSLHNLALLYSDQGRYADAEPLFRQALELYKQLLGEQHPHVATSLNNLALLYYYQGRYADAEPLFRQALELRKQLLGEQHPDVALSLSNLALLYDAQGRYADAEPLFRQALELTKQLLGEQHPDVAQSLNNLALLYKSQGR
ncbi:MAG: tetratricopeptide repeat protein, partial [Cyanobacteria bacterium P01_A01_bin.40]